MKKKRKSHEVKIEDAHSERFEKIGSAVIYILLFLIGLIPAVLSFSSTPKGDYNLDIFHTRVGTMVGYISSFDYPSINADLNLGEFNAYYPFSFMLGSMFSIITGNVFLGTSIARIVISLLAALAFYSVCRWEKTENVTSIVLTFLYCFSIYYLILLKGSLSWALAFVFVPVSVYAMYRVIHEDSPKFELLFVISSFLLILSTLAPMMYIFYFGLVYIVFLKITGSSAVSKNSVLRFFKVLLFSFGLASFYLLFLLDVQDKTGFAYLQSWSGFAGTVTNFIKSGISPATLLFPDASGFTTFGIVIIILFIYSLYLKKNDFTDLDRYLFLLFCLTLIASFFPITVAYLPFIGHTEAGWRSFVIAVFISVFLARHGLTAIKKYSYPAILLIAAAVILQLYFTPGLFLDKSRYADDVEKFHALINPQKVTRVNYYISVNYPPCKNCIALGAPENYYGNVMDERTRRIWGYIDFAQRNPPDPVTGGFLGEEYLIALKKNSDAYVKNGYVLLDSGDELALFSNPNATSIFQFYDKERSLNLVVQRKGRVFFSDFDAPSDGFVLFKFSYYPLASVLDNGKSVEVKEEENGLIIAPVKQGHHRIEFYYRNMSNYYYVSILFFFIVILHYASQKKWIMRSHFEK